MIQPLFKEAFDESEIVIALVGILSTDFSAVSQALREQFERHGYHAVHEISIERDIIPPLLDTAGSDAAKSSQCMQGREQIWTRCGDPSALAYGVAAMINHLRPPRDLDEPPSRAAYIVSSVSRQEEVHRLRDIYQNGFFLIGIHADETPHLHGTASHGDASKRDEATVTDHESKLTEAFHLADFFVRDDGETDLEGSLSRVVDLIFGHPHLTPVFDEYAMFLAFAASLRSADLSRQVGAVIARDEQILATGGNDCPRAGGGLYWPRLEGGVGIDFEGGRDYMRGEDSNAAEKKRIIADIVEVGGRKGLDEVLLREALEASPIRDLTEFGRVVHAEMDALLSCARQGTPTRDATLYSTTYPCHNCAKHIVAAGIRRVVYVQPYAKSKALEFHDEAIVHGLPAEGQDDGEMVRFEPFVGVGPRRYFDLFSMSVGSGFSMRRKQDGKAVDWERDTSRLRLQLLPLSYLEVEKAALVSFELVKLAIDEQRGS